eukprot:scaffold3643_cov267-Pinguiococcus_pyrenoidosus.AAC.6
MSMPVATLPTGQVKYPKGACLLPGRQLDQRRLEEVVQIPQMQDITLMARAPIALQRIIVPPGSFLIRLQLDASRQCLRVDSRFPQRIRIDAQRRRRGRRLRWREPRRVQAHLSIGQLLRRQEHPLAALRVKMGDGCLACSAVAAGQVVQKVLQLALVLLRDLGDAMRSTADFAHVAVVVRREKKARGEFLDVV